MNSDKDSVRVAVRIRPLIDSETIQGCKSVLDVFHDLKQIKLKDSNMAFTYNYVFDMNSAQDQLYNTCVKDLLEELFKGYNVTILAYGQTGSGKTYSMGTSYDGKIDMGVIPRAVNDIFVYINDNFLYEFTVTVSFIELYQEVVYDLLANKPREQCTLEIREDDKGILLPGLTEIPVLSAVTALNVLSKGAESRATRSTNMNAQSSRSHAIFTINICMQKKGDPNSNKTAKFHLVDLAGSERSKKTGATGQVFKEGVNINKGLLALGNVISALGDEKSQGGFICYRDSNLTRLLKDSLGGNSITLMICCVSPADYNCQETVSTLRYADRARKIKNKPIVNQDPKAAEINRLNKLVQQLRLELVGQGGSFVCQAELEQIQRELETLKLKNRELTLQLSATLTEKTSLHERIMIMQAANEALNKKLHQLKDNYNVTVNVLSQTFEENNPDLMKGQIEKLRVLENLFSDLDCQLTKNEDEIRLHELRASINNDGDPGFECDLSSEQESHMKKQFAMNFELQELTKTLAMKEDLAQKILANANHFVNYDIIAEDESKVAVLQKEKEELTKQLKEVCTTGASSKLAEQRRLRVLELEKQIQDLQKKINEQARMIRFKERDEQKIKQLNNEIGEMKHTKVKLIKTMKQETDRFNNWKRLRERELKKLREQDRKRLDQITKMENIHTKQQNVLKRKVEEAIAINKRLKDSLALRRNIQEQKNFGKVERMVPWVQQELEVAVNTIDAEGTITHLLEERAMLTNQLDQIKTSTSVYNTDDLKQLEEDIDVRSIQIRDLQQKILDSDQENKSKSRWDNVQSMGDAKFLLKTLFDITTESRLKDLINQQKILELATNQEEVNQRMKDQESSVNALKLLHKSNLALLHKEYEEKITVLLRQLRGITVAGVGEQLTLQCSIQQERLEQLEHENSKLKEENIKYSEDAEDLRSRIKQINEQLPPPPQKKAKTKKASDLPPRHLDFLDEEENLNSTFEDPFDPDWQKTPLAKRLRKIKATSQTQDTSRLTIKRSFDGACACKTNCEKRTCGCKKFGKSCTERCKCTEATCVNRFLDKENLTNTTETSSFDIDETDSTDNIYKKSRTLSDGNSTFNIHPIRRNKTFSKEN